jgi:hypothetical protein
LSDPVTAACYRSQLQASLAKDPESGAELVLVFWKMSIDKYGDDLSLDDLIDIYTEEKEHAAANTNTNTDARNRRI